MTGDLATRREILKAAAAVGVAALAREAGAQATVPAAAPASAPSGKSGMIVGMPDSRSRQLAGDADTTDRLFDTLRTVGGINTLFLFAFGHKARFLAPLNPANFRGGTYGIPHMAYYKDSNLTFNDLPRRNLAMWTCWTAL